jgi:hypothetical protein
MAHDQVSVASVSAHFGYGELIRRDAVAHPFSRFFDAVPFDTGEKAGFAGVMAVTWVGYVGEPLSNRVRSGQCASASLTCGNAFLVWMFA